MATSFLKTCAAVKTNCLTSSRLNGGKTRLCPHPLAGQDITEIWEYIAADNPLAARRVREEIYSAIRAFFPFPGVGHRRPDLTSRPLRFILVREYLITYRRMKSRCGLSPSCTDAAAPHYGRNPYRQRVTGTLPGARSEKLNFRDTRNN